MGAVLDRFRQQPRIVHRRVERQCDDHPGPVAEDADRRHRPTHAHELQPQRRWLGAAVRRGLARWRRDLDPLLRLLLPQIDWLNRAAGQSITPVERRSPAKYSGNCVTLVGAVFAASASARFTVIVQYCQSNPTAAFGGST